MPDTKHSTGSHRAARFASALAAGLLGAIFICASALPVMANEDVLDVDTAQALPDGSLSSMRGGFRIGGFDISFGMTIKAAIDGATELQTSFNLLNGNQISNQSVSLTQDGTVVFSQGDSSAKAGGQGASIPLSNAQFANQSNQSNAPSNGAVLATTPNGFSLVQLDEGGYALTSVDTTIIQSIGNNSILSEVSNTANNRVIQTSLSANLFFNNFAEMAGRSDMNSLMTHLISEQMNAGMLGP